MNVGGIDPKIAVEDKRRKKEKVIKKWMKRGRVKEVIFFL